MSSKKDSGINLKSVSCPKCRTKQPWIRMPKDWREAFFGGYTCSNCYCKMDKYGKERILK